MTISFEQNKLESTGDCTPAHLAELREERPYFKQFMEFKKKYPDAIMLFRCGDFYECFNADAEKVADTLGLLVKEMQGVNGLEFVVSFPFHALDTYLPKLVRARFRVAICDQLEDPKLMKKVVKREAL